jgi:hypothetical protein
MENYCSFGNENYDIVINCVGIAQPKYQKKLAKKTIEISDYFDKMVLKYLESHPETKYVFMSSGVVHETDKSAYKESKINAEKRHRAMDANIVDLRLYSFFSRYTHEGSGFYMDEVVRCIKTGDVLGLMPIPLYRDYVSPEDLAKFILTIKPLNRTYEIFSTHPVSTFDIARHFKKTGLVYKELEMDAPPTGLKEHYYAKRHDGFIPNHTSMEVLIEEVHHLIT